MLTAIERRGAHFILYCSGGAVHVPLYQSVGLLELVQDTLVLSPQGEKLSLSVPAQLHLLQSKKYLTAS